MTATDVAATAAAGALGQTISVDRALHEAARELRLNAAADAVAIAFARSELETPRLRFQTGFARDAGDIETMLQPTWRSAMAGVGQPLVRAGGDGVEVTVGFQGAAICGAVTVVVDTTEGSAELGGLQRVTSGVATQLANALDRADVVRRLVQKRRLEAVGEVAAGVAHELRNPLFGISSAAQLLRFRTHDDPVVEKNVGRILREVERLNAMAEALLEYGRVPPLRTQARDADDLWEDVIQTQRGRLESRVLALHHSPAQPRATVDLDVEQMAQVFSNVLTNAIEAAPEGTDLILSSARLSSGAWSCRLHNEGAAIPADVLPRVFELFFSTKAGRTGVGLPLCQRIIDAHGGTIALDNASQGGVDVVIVLPPANA